MHRTRRPVPDIKSGVAIARNTVLGCGALLSLKIGAHRAVSWLPHPRPSFRRPAQCRRVSDQLRHSLRHGYIIGTVGAANSQQTRRGDGEVKCRRAAEMEVALHGHAHAVNDRSEAPVDSR